MLQTPDGPLVNFASNDYLGLAGDPRLAEAAGQAIDGFGWGSGASPLICGYTEEHQQLEADLARFEGTEAAIVFNSGFAANLGTVAALVGLGDVVLGDRLNHASLIDGCRLSGARFRTWPHGDLDRLENLLQKESGTRRLIVTDTLFSMDGDFAPLADLADLAERYQAMLLVDEAHATGVFGPHGRGLVEQCGVEQRVDIRIGTLSKALGSVGGFVAGRRVLIEWLVNRARNYIYSTAFPAAACAAGRAALRIVDSEPQRRAHLLALATRLRSGLTERGWGTGPGHSQIVPVLLGSAERAVETSARLRAAGLWVPAIRPPSVRPDTSRLRVSLTAAHLDEHVDQLLAALGDAPPAEC